MRRFDGGLLREACAVRRLQAQAVASAGGCGGRSEKSMAVRLTLASGDSHADRRANRRRGERRRRQHRRPARRPPAGLNERAHNDNESRRHHGLHARSPETPALTKAQLAELLFEQIGLNKRESKDMVDAFFDLIVGQPDRRHRT